MERTKRIPELKFNLKGISLYSVLK